MALILDLAPIAFAFFIVAVSPGPANLAVATISMRFGYGAGLRFGMGLGVGLAVWGCVAATGMGAVLQTSAVVLTALKVFGGLYLIWLALQSWRAAGKHEPAVSAFAQNRGWFFKGLLLNLSNPKAVVAWMATLSMGMGSNVSASLLIAATLVCVGLGFLNYAGHAYAFSRSGFMNGYQRFRRGIESTVAVLFAGAGFALLRSAISR